MSFVKEFENFGPQCGWDSHTFPEQDTSLLKREGLSASVKAFELRPVGVLAEESQIWPAGLNEFLHCL
jgi:hypothetical protein